MSGKIVRAREFGPLSFTCNQAVVPDLDAEDVDVSANAVGPVALVTVDEQSTPPSGTFLVTLDGMSKGTLVIIHNNEATALDVDPDGTTVSASKVALFVYDGEELIKLAEQP